MKAGEKIKRRWDMARNLVAEKEKIMIEGDKQITGQVAQPSKEPEVRVVTFEALIANNLEALNTKVDKLEELIKEGFKQVGVKYE
jgi:hypothetical protein